MYLYIDFERYPTVFWNLEWQRQGSEKGGEGVWRLTHQASASKDPFTQSAQYSLVVTIACSSPKSESI